MSTLNGLLNLSSGALAADQAAIDISANNTANANTPGYTRELPVWQEQDYVSLNGQSYGSGVLITGAASQRDRVLEQSIQQQTQAQQQTNTALTELNQIQSIFNDTSTATGAASTGIGASLNSFFNALSSLEATPADGSIRQGVLEAAQNLAQSFNAASSQLQTQTNSLNQQVGAVVGQVNSLLTNIATLNNQIKAADPNTDAGALEDQRQQDINQLSQNIGLHQISTEGNGITLTTTNGALLVSGGQSLSLSTMNSGGNIDVVGVLNGTSQDITSGLTGGQLGGILQVRNTDIPQVQTQIDTLAYDIGTQLNTVNAGGLDANGNPGGNFFNLPGSSAGAASSISVAITDPNLIAAAGAGEGVSGNTNATAMANLQSTAIVSGSTPSDYYSAFLTQLGTMVSNVSTQNTAQQASLTQLTSQRNALSGVTLDEEASNLTEYERSYQAASKLFTIVDSLMSSALNLGVDASVA
ncbi:MAG: flagellar hook-associated protein FlgK [Acidobacteriaceae bacterium]